MTYIVLKAPLNSNQPTNQPTSGHSHYTRFCGSMSGQLDISASIIQGSAIGPASYVVNAADLTTVTAGNLMFKYADDTYIVIPAINTNLLFTNRW